MAERQRLFFDESFTRTQTGSVGITRTVRRLRQELDGVLPDGQGCIPVAFHTRGFRAVDRAPPTQAAGRGRAAETLAARLLRWTTESFARRLAFALLPLPVLYHAWRLHSGWTYDALTGDCPPVRFTGGDTLLMCDAAWGYQAWKAADAARRQGAAVVVMIHDLIPLTQPQFCAPLFTLVFRKWLHAMLACVDGVICNSAATEAELHAYAAGQGLRLPPTAPFRLGSDLPVAPDARVRKSIETFLDGQVPCFGAVGTVEARKNYGWLLDVFEELWAEGVEARLLIAGRPNADSHALVRRMKQHPEQGSRLLTVFDASDAEIAGVYAHCRALVFSSRAEGFGLPLVEARVRGCPVIAGELPAFAELADQGVFFYQLQDKAACKALLRAHAAENQRATVGAVRPFGWRESARNCLEAVARVLRARAEAGAPGSSRAGAAAN